MGNGGGEGRIGRLRGDRALGLLRLVGLCVVGSLSSSSRVF